MKKPLSNDPRDVARRVGYDTIGPDSLKVLLLILDHRARKGYSPSFSDLMAMTGIASKNGMKWHLRVLQRMGLIQPLQPKLARSVVPAVQFVPVEDLDHDDSGRLGGRDPGSGAATGDAGG